MNEGGPVRSGQGSHAHIKRPRLVGPAHRGEDLAPRLSPRFLLFVQETLQPGRTGEAVAGRSAVDSRRRARVNCPLVPLEIGPADAAADVGDNQRGCLEMGSCPSGVGESRLATQAWR